MATNFLTLNMVVQMNRKTTGQKWWLSVKYSRFLRNLKIAGVKPFIVYVKMSENPNLTDIREEISPWKTCCWQFSEMKFKTSIFIQHWWTNLSVVTFKLAVPTKNQNASFSILPRCFELCKIPKTRANFCIFTACQLNGSI